MKSTHDIERDQPEMVIQAIRDVWQRSTGPSQ
jgi:hypothetical protein